MKSELMILGLCFALALSQATQVQAFKESSEDLRKGMQTKWIPQKLDNFNERDTRTWNMRYLVDDRYLKPNGPIFIRLFGEFAVDARYEASDIMTDLAREHNGILFYPEHRYYGESKPTPDLSTENLQFLSVQQALADLANFINTQRYNNFRLKKSKVIISGCFYGGSMAIWFSKLYPNLVHGIWASSAPTLVKADFKEFLEVVGDNFRKQGSQQCYERIRNGIAELEAMFKSNRAAEAQQMLKLCNGFNHKNQMDLSSLFNFISIQYSDIAVDDPERDIPEICRSLMRSEDDVTAVAEFYTKKLPSGGKCLNVDYQGYLNMYKDTSYRYKIVRPRLYSRCNQFGWLKVSSSKKQPFGSLFPVRFFTKMCSDVFGNKYTHAEINRLVDETNKFFSSKKFKLKNSYITYGAFDPWYPVGMVGGSTFIPKASHCDVVGSIRDSDSPAVRDSKKHLFQLVSNWLK